MQASGEQWRSAQAGQQHRVRIREGQRLRIEDVRVEEAARIPAKLLEHPSGAPHRKQWIAEVRHRIHVPDLRKEQHGTDDTQASGCRQAPPPRDPPRDVVCRRVVQPIDTTAPVSPSAREERDARRKRQTHHCQHQRDDSGTHSVPRRQADASEDDVGTAGGGDVEREARKNQDEPVQHERKPDSRSVVERHVSGFYPLRTPSARSSTRIRSSMSAAKKVSASGPVTGAWAISAMPASSPNTAT